MDSCRMEISAWCLSFHKAAVNFGRVSRQALELQLELGLAESSKGVRGTEVLPKVGTGAPKSELCTGPTQLLYLWHRYSPSEQPEPPSLADFCSQG